MLQVIIPNNYQPERQYAASVLLQDWLRLPVEFQYGATPFAAEIKLENGNRLLLEDHFFSRFPSENNTYLRPENLPSAPVFSSKQENSFLHESDLPILFGTGKLEISDREITCGADLFASAFFMLTRWEEYVLHSRDEHGRFPAKDSWAGKNGILHRPVVNEYLDLLWNMLVHLGIRHERKHRRCEFMLTCDVDMALLWRSPWFFLKKLGGDLLKRLDFQAVTFDLKSFFRTRFLNEKDPFNTFDYLMDCAERQGRKVHFFFLCGGSSKFDQALPLESPFVKSLLEKIKSRGHYTGIHPSYLATSGVAGSIAFQREKAKLEKMTGLEIKNGRQHFLRFEAPATWQMWEDNGMDWDSTMYYSEQPGFRCGTCFPFPVFNFLTRQRLQLVEIPLTAMEVSWIVYKRSSPEEMLAELNTLAATVRKYRGCFVLLWHNSSFNTQEFSPYRLVFEDFMNSFEKADN